MSKAAATPMQGAEPLPDGAVIKRARGRPKGKKKESESEKLRKIILLEADRAVVADRRGVVGEPNRQSASGTPEDGGASGPKVSPLTPEAIPKKAKVDATLNSKQANVVSGVYPVV